MDIKGDKGSMPSSADDSIPSLSIPSLVDNGVNETFDDDACSMPSLSVNETFDDEACSMPSLPTSTSVRVEDSTTKSSSLSPLPLQSFNKEDVNVNQTNSNSGLDFVQHIQQEMLQVSIDKMNLVGRDLIVGSTNQTSVPHLYTSQRPEERENNIQSKIVRERDSTLLSPLELPVFKTDSEELFPASKSKKAVAQNSKKQVLQRSDQIMTASRGIQCSKMERAAIKTKPLNTKEKSVQVVVEEEKCEGDQADQNVEESTRRKDKPENDDTRPECKTLTEIDSQKNVHSSSGNLAKIDEPLYKVMAVSAPRSKPKVVDVSSNHAIPKQSNGEKKSAYSSIFMKGLETSQNLQVKNEVVQHNTFRVLNNDANVTGINGTSTSIAKSHDEGKRESSDYTQNNDVAQFVMTSRRESTSNHGRARHESNEMSTQTNNIKKAVVNAATHTVQQGSSRSNKYENKLCSLENELKGIRILLEETKSKSKSSIASRKGGHHIPSSIAVPKVLPGKFAYGSPSNRTSSTISTIPPSRGKSEAQLKCKTKLFQVENNRRRNTIAGDKKQFVSGTFSPTSSFCGDDSVSFVEPKRRPSRQLLQPRPSILKVERINHEETEANMKM